MWLGTGVTPFAGRTSDLEQKIPILDRNDGVVIEASEEPLASYVVIFRDVARFPVGLGARRADGDFLNRQIGQAVLNRGRV